MLQSATRIEDPTKFVTEVYRHYVAAQSTHKTYSPPDNIYSARLAKLIREDREKAKGEVGCLDFDFWVDGQDWTIKDVSVTSQDQGKDRKVVVAKFVNLGEREEIHFDFQQTGGRWVLDDVHSLKAPQWTLSKILKCAP